MVIAVIVPAGIPVEYQGKCAGIPIKKIPAGWLFSHETPRYSTRCHRIWRVFARPPENI